MFEARDVRLVNARERSGLGLRDVRCGSEMSKGGAQVRWDGDPVLAIVLYVHRDMLPL
jgi:hypothetical protein